MGNQEKQSESAEATIQVVDQAQLRAVVSTVRHDILDQVSAFGPLAVSDIADLLGASASSLYYHIEQLLAVGLLVEDGS
ncbi:MAG: helix-turn-helix transcriptional regulator [Novosphingobium sp.]|uniref:winged helix-turn-helix domain-containing protein n=1 Tax=Novosphingobium sp. TaxID=1874826 RepID=UPI001DE16CEE|nr:helix-turn-helix domain-containing protein [Novosphingobium sp.]MCB2057224.1 helix-turn-helix transcriptional regulator [Novosphingobium sp.]MCP5386383.1 helix-turn-helix transcriptional regulator [Novosphingobium sp.]